MKSAIRKAGPVPTSEGNTSCWQGTSTHLPGKMHRTGFFAPLIFVVSGNRHHEFYDSMSIFGIGVKICVTKIIES